MIGQLVIAMALLGFNDLGFKCYLNYLLENERGLFLSLQCNYDVNQINISSTFYHDLLAWWSNTREVEDPNVYKYIIWNKKELKVDGKSVFL